MEDKQLNAAESLALISRMIDNTRHGMERYAGRPMLIWGYATIAVTLTVCAALHLGMTSYTNYIWLAIPAIGYPLTHFTAPKHTEGYVMTFVDRTLLQVWGVIGGSAVMVSLCAIFGFSNFPILFVIALLIGIASTITGYLTNFKPSIYCGIGATMASVGLTKEMGYWQLLVFCLLFVIMCIVPGHILNYRAKHQKVKH